jgi:hypothetical protein
MFEIYIEPFTDGLLGIITGLVMWLLTVLLIGLVLYGLFYVADSCWLPSETSTGVLVNKWIVPEHYTTTYVQSGKVMIPITSLVQTTWNLQIQINGISDNVSVGNGFYNECEIGVELLCDYVNGRFSDEIYISSIY